MQTVVRELRDVWFHRFVHERRYIHRRDAGRPREGGVRDPRRRMVAGRNLISS